MVLLNRHAFSAAETLLCLSTLLTSKTRPDADAELDMARPNTELRFGNIVDTVAEETVIPRGELADGKVALRLLG